MEAFMKVGDSFYTVEGLRVVKCNVVKVRHRKCDEDKYIRYDVTGSLTHDNIIQLHSHENLAKVLGTNTGFVATEKEAWERVKRYAKDDIRSLEYKLENAKNALKKAESFLDNS